MTDKPQRGPRKDATLTIRLTSETKSALERAAQEQGRNISAVAELWLDTASRGRADLKGRLGSDGVADALLAMAEFAHLIRDEVGDPHKSLAARDALIEGWSGMIARALPFTPDTPDGATARIAQVEARGMIDALLDNVNARPTGAAADWLVGSRAERGGGLLGTGKGRPLLMLLSDYSFERPMTRSDVQDIVALLNAAPDHVQDITPRPGQVAAAVQDAYEKTARYMAPRREAQAKGRAIAAGCTAPQVIL